MVILKILVHLYSIPEYSKENKEDDTIDETTIAERIVTILLLSKPFTCWHMQNVWSLEFTLYTWWLTWIDDGYTRLELDY